MTGKTHYKHVAFRFIAASLAAVAVTGAALISAGCGGGGGGGGSAPNNTPPASLATDKAALNNLISTGTTPTVTQLTTVAANLKADYLADPSDADAATAYAIAEAALDGDTYASDYGSSIASLGSTSLVKKADAVSASSAGQFLTIWNVPSLLVQGKTPSLSVANFIPLTPLQTAVGAKTSDGDSPAQIQTDLANLDADLATVQTALGVGISQNGYYYTIPSPSSPNTSYKIGSAELEVLDSFVELIRSVLNVSLIYSADYTNYPNGQSPASTVFAAQLATAGTVIPTSSFLPGSPFLTLESDGKTRAANVSSELTLAGNNAVTAISTFESRNNAGYLLGLVTGVTTAQLNNASSEITTYKSYLTTTVTVNGSNNPNIYSLKVDIGAILSNPPPTLSQFLPSLTVNYDTANSVPDVFYTNANYSDLTFGGLFPGGLSSSSLSGGTPLDINGGITVEDLALYSVGVNVNPGS